MRTIVTNQQNFFAFMCGQIVNDEQLFQVEAIVAAIFCIYAHV